MKVHNESFVFKNDHSFSQNETIIFRKKKKRKTIVFSIFFKKELTILTMHVYHLLTCLKASATKVGFIFFGPHSGSRASYLAAVNHVTQLSSKLGLKYGLKAGFKTLRHKPKLLNNGLKFTHFQIK